MKDIIASGAYPVIMPRDDPAGKIIFVVLLLVVLVLSYTAIVALLAALLRGQTERARQVVAESPIGTVLIGLFGWVILGTLAAWLFSQAFVEHMLETASVPAYLVAACVTLIVPMLICILGAPGLYTHIGSRIAALRTRETSDFWCVVVGTIACLTAAIFPFVGWFLVLPLLMAAELGAGLRSLLR